MRLQKKMLCLVLGVGIILAFALSGCDNASNSLTTPVTTSEDDLSANPSDSATDPDSSLPGYIVKEDESGSWEIEAINGASLADLKTLNTPPENWEEADEDAGSMSRAWYGWHWGSWSKVRSMYVGRGCRTITFYPWRKGYHAIRFSNYWKWWHSGHLYSYWRRGWGGYNYWARSDILSRTRYQTLYSGSSDINYKFKACGDHNSMTFYWAFFTD